MAIKRFEDEISNKILDIYFDNTTSMGGGLSHNNMSPYLSVYVFKKI